MEKQHKKLIEELQEKGLSENTKKWIRDNFNEVWEEFETDIDFKKYEPIEITDSLHIIQYLYDIDGEKYRVSYPISDHESKSLIEKLKK